MGIDHGARPLRLALLGAGAWARVAHLSALAGRDDVIFDSVFDPDIDRAAETALEFGFADVGDSVHAVLERSPDACIIASPASAHAEQAIAALEAGCHLLLEKPMTTSASDAWHIVEVARAYDRHVVLALGWNYSPLFAAARDLLAASPIGRLEHAALHMASGTRDLLSGASADSSGRRDRPALPSTWTDPAMSGGGFGNAQLSHALGVLFGLVDSPVAQLVGISRSGPIDGIELSVAIAGRLGESATLAVSGVAVGAGSPRQELTLGLYGSDALVRIDFARDLLARVDSRGEHLQSLPRDAGAYPGTAPANALVDLLTGRRSTNASGAVVGARTTEVLDVLKEIA